MRTGAALLVVLIIVMVVCVMSMSFLTHSNVQMVCGQNTILRMQMDYLADSGLVYAKTLLLNPQEAITSPDGYWTGDTIQIEAGDDYCDITVIRSVAGATNRCTYDIQSKAYRDEGSGEVAQSNLKAQLRLDPCIGYWAGGSGNIPNTVTVNGDVYCDGILTSSAVLNGDVFAADFTGSSAGQHYVSTPDGVIFPGLQTGLYTPQYDYVEDWDSPAVVSYSSRDLQVNDCNNPSPNPPVSFAPDSFNPAGVLCRAGDLELIGDIDITGTLVVVGDVIVKGPGTTTISLLKNFPAIVVTGTLRIEASGCLEIEGLVQANAMTVAADAGNITILGALFINTSGMTVAPGYGGDINITIDPMKSAVITAYNPGPTFIKWSPAGGAFFKNIRRN